MRINVNSSGPNPITPNKAQTPETKKTATQSKSAGPPDPGKVAEERSQALSSPGAQLLKPAGSAAEFETIGMKVLMQTAQGAQQTKIGMKEAQQAKAPEKQEADRNQAWTNVANSIFGTTVGAASAAVKGVAGHIQKGDFEKATESFKGLFAGSLPPDINQIIQQVLRESYMETSKDLQFYAEKMKHFNDTKKDVREKIGQLRGVVTKDASVADSIKKMEERLQSVGDDAQLANVDLQNMLQKQQQTMQMMSTISKVLHDTATAVIRKIG